MNIAQGFKDLLLAVVPVSAAVLTAGDARADVTGWQEYHHEYAATTCHRTPGLSIYAGAFVNSSGVTQSMSCPLPVNGDGNTAINLAAAFATGPTNSVSCWIVSTARGGAYSVFYPTSRIYPGGYDQMQWGGPIG